MSCFSFENCVVCVVDTEDLNWLKRVDGLLSFFGKGVVIYDKELLLFLSKLRGVDSAIGSPTYNDK